MRTMEETFCTGSELGTSGAGFASIERVDFNYINSFNSSLVFDEALQLIETPAVEPEVESPAFFHVPYSPEVFHYNCISGLYIGDNGLADIVVNPSLEALLSARELFKQSPGRPCAFGLKFRPQMLELEHLGFDFISREELFLACNSNMVYSKVDANDFISRIGINSIDVSGESDADEHSSFFVKSKFSSLITPIEILPVTFWDFNWNVYSSIDCCEPDFIKKECKCSSVEINRHVFFENRSGIAFARFEGLESLGCNPVGIDDELTFQFEPFSSPIVSNMMEFIPIGNAVVKSELRNVRNTLGIFFHSIKQNFIKRNFQLNRSNRFHIMPNNLIEYINPTGICHACHHFFTSYKLQSTDFRIFTQFPKYYALDGGKAIPLRAKSHEFPRKIKL